ncbi:MAG: secretion system protein [Ilumatobacteraceae bacterium]|nr:secretion system protein [Ilumatobacteraceae bacterium]
MMLMAMIVAGACAGGGVLIIARGLVGTTEPLTALVTELHRPRTTAATAGRSKRLSLEALAGRSTPDRASDLAVCERDLGKYVQDRLLWAAMFGAPGALLLLLSVTGSASFVSPSLLLIALVGGATGGWFYARIDLRSDADRSRREFRHALAAYLELVTILMAGGAGVETAMFDAAAVGHGTAFRHLRSALTAAQARREPPWRALGELGNRLGVNELIELEASMTLAGGGALVRDSLNAKAEAIRAKDLAQLESDAEAKSETMVLPVAMMFAGFLLLIGYPALAALSTP